MKSILPTTQRQRQRGSVTIENVVWALAVIAIAAVVVSAITTFVANHANQLIGL
ncbi:MAG: hypothetical protein FWG08_06930 [Propionibacteriaceae bacterium]|nr:hypothetical protein [Propionibacteriaceae bacterium]